MRARPLRHAPRRIRLTTNAIVSDNADHVKKRQNLTAEGKEPDSHCAFGPPTKSTGSLEAAWPLLSLFTDRVIYKRSADSKFYHAAASRDTGQKCTPVEPGSYLAQRKGGKGP